MQKELKSAKAANSGVLNNAGMQYSMRLIYLVD